MDKLDRKELKHDRFVEEVQHSVEFVSGHKSQVTLYVALAVAVIVVAVGTYFYMDKAHSERQAELRDAVQNQEGAVGQGSPDHMKVFPTQAAKDEAAIKGFNNVVAKYGSKDEGAIARYYLGIIAADQGKLDEAAKHFKQVADDGSKDYASLAKFSLSQINSLQGKQADAEKLLKEIEDSPTAMVSKEQALIERARLLAKTKPDEARKLLEPLRTNERSAVSRSALTTLAELGK